MTAGRASASNTVLLLEEKPNMKKLVATSLITLLLTTLVCSFAYCAPGDIWLAGYLLLCLKTPNDCSALQHRVDVVQMRANDLLALSSTLPKITVKKSGANYGIYTDKKIFLTVTSADAKAGRTSAKNLANSWAQRLRKILPEATPIKH